MTASSEITQTTEAESEARESPVLPKRHFVKALVANFAQHQTLKPNTSWLITLEIMARRKASPID